MNRAKYVLDGDGRFYGLRFDCPGCTSLGPGFSSIHILPVEWCPQGYEPSPHAEPKPRWTFNGNLRRPTFSPSILSRIDYDEENIKHVCHSYVTDGRIQYLGDCTHALAGQTVDLPELDP